MRRAPRPRKSLSPAQQRVRGIYIFSGAAANVFSFLQACGPSLSREERDGAERVMEAARFMAETLRRPS